MGEGISFEDYWNLGTNTEIHGLALSRDYWGGYGLASYKGAYGDSITMEIMNYPGNGFSYMSSISPTYSAEIRVGNARATNKGYVQLSGKRGTSWTYLMPAVTPSASTADTSIAVWIGSTPKFIDYTPNTDQQGFTGSDNGIDFTLNLANTSNDITISEGESITIARTDTKLTVGTTQALNSGTYTPTLFNTTNVDSSTPSVMGYMRVGNTVTVYGEVLINVTSGSSATVLGMTLPISSNLTGGGDLGGSVHSNGAPSNSGSITGDITNDRAYIVYRSSADTGDVIYAVHFSYQIK
jgi:hypothetical protein